MTTKESRDGSKIDTLSVGQLISMKGRCSEDEKVIVRDGMFVITKKTSLDRLVERIKI